MELWLFPHYSPGTPFYYIAIANHLAEIIEKQRVIIVYTDFAKDAAPIAIALAERGP